jgi:CRISPR-associated protein Csx3
MKNNPEQFNKDLPGRETPETNEQMNETVIEQKEKEPKYKPYKLVIAGPAHSGKSVLSTSIIENFPDGCNIFHATPDGEGDWSQSTENILAQKLREKEKFSTDFVEKSVKMIEGYRNKMLFVDTGGKIDGEDLPLIFNEADKIIILSREDEIAGWENLVKKSGKKMLAVIISSLEGEDVVSTDEEGVIRGRITGLKRGAKVHSVVIEKLAEALKPLIPEHCEDEERADVNFAKLAEELKISRHKTGGRFDWQPEHLAVAAELIKKSLEKHTGDVHVWGTAPMMLWGVASAAARPAKLNLHDPFKGYVEIPELKHSPDGSKNLVWIVNENDGYTFIKYQIKGTHFGDRNLEEVQPPMVKKGKGVVIAGKGPWWLTTAIQEAYKDAPWIALLQPQISNKKINGGGVAWHELNPNQVPAVVVSSNIDGIEIGKVLPVDIENHSPNDQNGKKPEQERSQSKSMTPERFAKKLIENLDKTSRTAKGISDTSSSDQKTELLVSGDKLKEKVRENFEKAIEFIWKEKYRTFSSEAELRKFVETAAAGISEGLLQKNQELFRTWETKLKHQTKPEDIEKDFKSFISELFKRLHSPHADGHKIAAFVEQRLDSRIHPFADGCGRTAKVISAWIMARYHLSFPEWTSRDEYYKNIEKDLQEWEKYYQAHIENVDSPITIHTHQFVDSDAVASLWAYKRYAVPETRETKIEFATAGEKSDLQSTDIFLDIDGGIKGKKESDGRTHSCFKYLLDLYAPPEEKEALRYLVEYIDRIDSYGPGNLLKPLGAETAKVVSENTLREILESLRHSNLGTDKNIYSTFEPILNGILERGKLRMSAEQEASRAEFPFGTNIAIIRDRKNPFSADLLFERGAKVVIYTDGNNIGAIRKDGESFSLKDLLEEKLGRQETGWFFHDHGFLAARGTFKNPSSSKSSIEPEKIAEILNKRIS